MRITFLISALFCAALGNLSSKVEAGFVYLNGVALSQVNSSTGANSSEPAEYDSFGTPNSDALINGGTGTPLLLNAGTNSFTITGQGGGYVGLGLYFTTTSALLQGASNLQPDFARVPDLWVYVGNSGFALSNPGTLVATIGQFSGTGAYSGAQTFTIDSQTISVTGWDGTSLSLNVSAVPEPTSIALMGIGGCLFMAARRKKSTLPAVAE